MLICPNVNIFLFLIYTSIFSSKVIMYIFKHITGSVSVCLFSGTGDQTRVPALAKQAPEPLS